MKISIITTTYNSASTLRDTLDSILVQTYKDYEVIVVDGASKDGTCDIIRKYEQLFAGRLKWKSEPDKGMYDAMNKGLARAEGDIVGFLNSDDMYYDADVLSDIARTMQDDKVGCVFGDLIYVDKHDIHKKVREWKGSPYNENAFRKGWSPAHPSFYTRRKWVKLFGGFKLDFAVSADFEFMFRYLQKHKVPGRYIPRYFVRMRMGGESNTSIRNIIRGNKNIIRAFHKNGYDAGAFYLLRRLLPKMAAVLKERFHRMFHSVAHQQ